MKPYNNDSKCKCFDSCLTEHLRWLAGDLELADESIEYTVVKSDTAVAKVPYKPELAD